MYIFTTSNIQFHCDYKDHQEYFFWILIYQERIFEDIDLFLMKSETSCTLQDIYSRISIFQAWEISVPKEILSKEK